MYVFLSGDSAGEISVGIFPAPSPGSVSPDDGHVHELDAQSSCRDSDRVAYINKQCARRLRDRSAGIGLSPV